LHEGRLLALDQPGQLRAGLTGTLFEVVVAAPREALDKLVSRPGIASAQMFGDRLHVWLDAADQRVAEAALANTLTSSGIIASHVRPIVPSLEDVFIAKLTL
jgi:hypothetical protein